MFDMIAPVFTELERKILELLLEIGLQTDHWVQTTNQHTTINQLSRQILRDLKTLVSALNNVDVWRFTPIFLPFVLTLRCEVAGRQIETIKTNLVLHRYSRQGRIQLWPGKRKDLAAELDLLQKYIHDISTSFPVKIETAQSSPHMPTSAIEGLYRSPAAATEGSFRKPPEEPGNADSSTEQPRVPIEDRSAPTEQPITGEGSDQSESPVTVAEAEVEGCFRRPLEEKGHADGLSTEQPLVPTEDRLAAAPTEQPVTTDEPAEAVSQRATVLTYNLETVSL
ncbi:hypothetical protein C8J56DRAFT_1164603, partial [Mycena floridula]